MALYNKNKFFGADPEVIEIAKYVDALEARIAALEEAAETSAQ